MAAAKETPHYAEGRAACRTTPPRLESVLGFRPLGLNPYPLWSDEYNAWNRGYEDAARHAAAIARGEEPG